MTSPLSDYLRSDPRAVDSRVDHSVETDYPSVPDYLLLKKLISTFKL